MKNRILLENYYLPGDLRQQFDAFVEHYNHRHYHESLLNLTPADVYFGRGQIILQQLQTIKQKSIETKRLLHRKAAAKSHDQMCHAPSLLTPQSVPKTLTTDRLVLRGTPARVPVAWIEGTLIDDGWLFRPISKSGRVLDRKLSPVAVSKILRKALVAAGDSNDDVSPHGLRSGFLTQAAVDGAPIQAAMRLSLHRSVEFRPWLPKRPECH